MALCLLVVEATGSVLSATHSTTDLWALRERWTGASPRERAHLFVDGVDGLQRASDHAELDDLTLVVDADDVHSVDVLAPHGGLELEDGRVLGGHPFGVAEV